MAASISTQVVAAPVTSPDPAAAVAVPAIVNGTFGKSSLYVGDLERNVSEGQLADLFNQLAQVISIRVCRDKTKQFSLGYAYVNFANPHDAANAMQLLNYTPLNGKPIRIMYSHRDPTMRKTGYANVFIKNLDSSIDNKALHETFAAFGTVLSSKVAVDSNGRSKGYGFVQFEKEEAAKCAIKQLNGMLLNDRQVYVGLFVRRQERIRVNGSPKFTNLYVKNLSPATGEEDLRKLFGAYGDITSAVVMKDENGKSRCFGFVNFGSPDSAATAVEKLNGTKLNDDKVLYVGRAQRKSEREAELKYKFEQEKLSKYEKLRGANLYMKNLNDSIDDEKLKELCSEFGTITSCKVLRDQHGVSRGCGFVAFSSPEEASKALKGLNGKFIEGKPLYVAVAQRKEERKARLQAYFSQLQATGGFSPFPLGLSGYPGAPRIGQPHMYQGTTVIIPQPGGYGFPQQLLSGIRPGLSPNFLLPYQLQRQGHPGNRVGVRGGGNNQMVHRQLLHRNNNQGLENMGHAISSVGTPMVGPMISLPSSVAGLPVTGPVPIGTLTTELAAATPDRRVQILGNQLYPLVKNIEPDYASKVTGMLLEMDQTELLHLIESPDALKGKVDEAMQALRESKMI